ncbi:MAG: CHAT domain-containing protein [Fuerstiella sp.]
MLPMATQPWSLFEDKLRALDDSGLLVVGDVDYDRAAVDESLRASEPLLLADASAQREVGRLRSSNAPTFVSLPGFRRELNLVDDLFQNQFTDLPARTLCGSNATESEFLRQAAHARILHVITHGYFADPSVKSISQAEIRDDGLISDHKGPDQFINTYMPGLLSGLAMAGANSPSTDSEDPRDGILRASEIEASSLQGVDLVVLSACETGLGKAAGGEGLTGLQRAFQLAGARTVVASLWKVEDNSTTQLMKLFYTNLWEKKMSKLDALREAQLSKLNHYDGEAGELRGSFTGKKQEIDPDKPAPKPARTGKRLDPRYWAAFQLSGDWR